MDQEEEVYMGTTVKGHMGGHYKIRIWSSYVCVYVMYVYMYVRALIHTHTRRKRDDRCSLTSTLRGVRTPVTGTRVGAVKELYDSTLGCLRVSRTV